MYLDVTNLQSFYRHTPLGRRVRYVLQERLLELWPCVHGEHILGYGYPVPFLQPFLEAAARAMVFMPAQQGVCRWPDKNNIAALVQETHWPLRASAVSRILFAHALENSEQVGALLDEAWRVLEPNGSIVFIVPNRVGLWARRDSTPFGFGRPYSLGQLEATLAKHRFECTSATGALYLPPSHRQFVLRTAKIIERFGQSVGLPYLSGVWIVEAIKHTYAAQPPAARAQDFFVPQKPMTGLAHAKIIVAPDRKFR